MISGLTFIFYGLLCLTTSHMINEFERYKLLRFRNLVGFLELLGGTGLLIGLRYSFIKMVASLGLSILMLLGVIVRVKIKDSFILIIPAFILMILNLYIFYQAMF